MPPMPNPHTSSDLLKLDWVISEQLNLISLRKRTIIKLAESGSDTVSQAEELRLLQHHLAKFTQQRAAMHSELTLEIANTTAL